MKPGMRMLLMNEMQNGGDQSTMRGGYENPRNGYDGGGMQGNYGGMQNAYKGTQTAYNDTENAYGGMRDGGMESRFRDRRGREHYDNGRYAPKNSYGDEEEEMRGGEDPEHQRPYLLGRGGKIGFESHDDTKPFDQQMAQEWTRSMRREDGGTGPKWTMEQARSLMTQIGAQGIQPAEFWAVLNAMYSDYCKVLKKFGMDRTEIYAELARAWLDDKDAVSDKAAAYYRHVVKH